MLTTPALLPVESSAVDLQHAYEHLRLVIEATPIAMVVATEGGSITLANKHAYVLFGFGTGELLGRPVDMLVPERFRTADPTLRSDYALALTDQPMGARHDLFGLRKDGSEVAIEIGLNPLQTPHGSFVLASIIDITERKHTEEHLRLLIEAAPNAIVVLDGAGLLVLVNSQAERLFGYQRAELLGHTIEILIPKRADGRDPFGLHKDGTKIPIEIGLNPSSTPQGEFVLASIIDITEHKRAEELRLAHIAELEAVNAELESFSYSVSHDLRAPVRAVLGYACAIEADYAPLLDDEGRRLLGVVQSEASRMGELIDDLLAFSRLGRQSMSSVMVNMTSLVRDVAAEEADLAGKQRAIVEISDLPGVTGDRVLLRQVWANLLSNAIKYSSKEPDQQLNVWATVEAGCVVYHVRDNGVGFDMQYAGKLFGVFQRLHRSDEFAGTGVGLAIVQRIVQRHGGSAWADARPNEGATFSFSLPICGVV
jgi:PAS domain S-box-containing protein